MSHPDPRPSAGQSSLRSSPQVAAQEAAQAAAGVAAPEFLAWARSHARDKRRHAADLAQITTHPEGDPTPDAIAQQKAWARRRTQDRVLHDSAIDQMRPSGRP